jgi:hypothetical protein
MVQYHRQQRQRDQGPKGQAEADQDGRRDTKLRLI